MKKINIVKKNLDFSRIIQNQRKYKFENYIIYIERTNDQVHRFGISVSKKIGNAVVRNKLKRQIKSIIDTKDYQNSFNCIIILKRGILNKNYKDMEQELLNAFSKLNIYKEDICEKK